MKQNDAEIIQDIWRHCQELDFNEFNNKIDELEQYFRKEERRRILNRFPREDVVHEMIKMGLNRNRITPLAFCSWLIEKLGLDK